MKSGLVTFSFYFTDLYKNACYFESAMDGLVERAVEIPRSVLSADIACGTSLEPPEGCSSWKGTITELEDKHCINAGRLSQEHQRPHWSSPALVRKTPTATGRLPTAQRAAS